MMTVRPNGKQFWAWPPIWQNLLRAIMLLVTLLTVALGAAAQQRARTLGPNAKAVLLGPDLSYWMDSSTVATPKQDTADKPNGLFRPQMGSIFVHPATPHPIWFRFRLRNQSQADSWLSVASTYVWYADLYRADTTGQLRLLGRAGSMLPARHTRLGHDAFYLPLATGSDTSMHEYYLRVQAELPFELPLYAGSYAELEATRLPHVFLGMGFLGVLLVMFLYNLVLYLATADRPYLWYLGYLLLMAMGIPFANSLPWVEHLHIWGLVPEHWHRYFLVWHGWVYLFIGLFSIDYLQLRTQLPRVWYLVWFLIVLLAGAGPLANAITGSYQRYISGYQLAILFFYFVNLFAGIYLWVRGHRTARFYVLGWSFMVLHVLVFFATVNGFFPYNFYTRNALYVGTGIEVWLFSVALAHRFSSIAKDKDRIQRDYNELLNLQNLTLQQRVAEHTQQLQEAVQEAQAANEELMAQTDELAEMNATKDKLFSIIGHDLLGPVSSVLSMLELAWDSKFSQEKFQTYVQSLYLNVENLQFMLSNLLHWANNQRHRLYCLPKEVNPHELAETAIGLLSLRAQRKGVELINEVESHITLWCDADQLQIVLLNLLNNAIKFTPTGGQVRIYGVEHEPDQYELSVHDTGVGMQPAELSSLFAQRQSTRGTQGEKGTGLGLSICKDFVQLNHGHLAAESTVGRGTRFYFRLPRYRDQQANNDQASAHIG